MSLFKKNPEEAAERRAEWSRKKHAKAREKLTKQGFDLDGCLLLDDSFDDGAYEYLLIFPDRIEYINTGKVSAILNRGRGVEVIPVSKISSVSTVRKMIFEVVQITTSGQVIEFKSDPYHASILKSKILELMTESRGSAPAPSMDPTEQILKLAELHKAGVITEAEFVAKKTELLGKI